MQTREILELQMQNFSGYHYFNFILFYFILFIYLFIYFLSTNIKGDFQIWISVPLIDFINSYPFSIFFFASFSQYLFFLNIFFQYFFPIFIFSQYFLSSGKMWVYPTLLISWFINFKGAGLSLRPLIYLKHNNHVRDEKLVLKEQ